MSLKTVRNPRQLPSGRLESSDVPMIQRGLADSRNAVRATFREFVQGVPYKQCQTGPGPFGRKKRLAEVD